jgi:hypothetical protein
MAQHLGKTLFYQGDLSYIEVLYITYYANSGGEHGDIAQRAWIFRRKRPNCS